MSAVMPGKLVFIGAGNMAEALVRGILAADLYAPDSICVTDIRAERLRYFKQTYGVQATADNAAAVRDATIVMLAVKPQVWSAVVGDFCADFPSDALLASIMAGVRCERIEAALGGQARVVRVMPNTPALVAVGASAVCGGRYAAQADVERIESLLGAVGCCVRVEESLMDAVTALSGSGPAYVFYMMEAMIAEGLALGLNAEMACMLTLQTFAGAAALARQSQHDPATLREQVTSPGGTTAAALESMAAKGFSEAVRAGMQAAARRSRELSNPAS